MARQMSMRPGDGLEMAEPAVSFCRCMTLETGLVVIAVLNFLESVYHYNEVFEAGPPHGPPPLTRAVSALLAVTEGAAALLLLNVKLGCLPGLVPFAYPVACITMLAEVLNLFIVTPLTLALDPDAALHAASSVATAVEFAAMDVYCVFIIWSYNKRAIPPPDMVGSELAIRRQSIPKDTTGSL